MAQFHHSQSHAIESGDADIQRLVGVLTVRLTELGFAPIGIDLHQRSTRFLVNVTLAKSAPLGSLYVAEQAIKRLVTDAGAAGPVCFFWRYRPTGQTALDPVTAAAGGVTA